LPVPHGHRRRVARQERVARGSRPEPSLIAYAPTGARCCRVAVFSSGEFAMSYAVLKFIHLSGTIFWIGGMAFVLFFLRPALAEMEVPARLRLMHAVLRRFLGAVLVAAGLLLVSGLWMLSITFGLVTQGGGVFAMPVSWSVMATLGVVMIAILGYIRLLPYPRLRDAVAAADWPAGGAALNVIRHWVTVNLVLGVLIVLVTVLGIAI